MKIGMLKVLNVQSYKGVAGILSVAVNIVLIILKFVLKEDVQNGALIINLVIMIIALIFGYSGILKADNC